MFSPLPPAPSTAERCADVIRRSILDGSLAVGSRLPPERALAASLGVNRVTVRTALTRLTVAGLVQARQGSGYTVRDYRAHGGPRLIPELVSLATGSEAAEAVLADLLLVRRHLAAAVAERALAGPLDLAGYDAAVDAFEAVVARTPEDDAAVGEADLGVVAALLEATGSAVLALCLNPVSAVVRDVPALRRAMFAEPAGNLAGWRALGALLRSRPSDAGALRATLTELLQARDAATLARLRAEEPAP